MGVGRYPWNLSPTLASDIEFGQAAKAHADLDGLLQLIAETSANDFALQKLRCAEVLNMCLRGARSGGVSTDGLLQDHLGLLKRLIKLRTWSEVKRHMHNSVEQWLLRVTPLYPSHMERVVRQIRRELRTDAGMLRSLEQYADAFGVSKSHLSRSFAAIAGRTFREELVCMRLEIACRLLEETSLKISVIAAEVGLRDPSQFIAYFRSRKGLTPAKYRQMRCSKNLVRFTSPTV